MKPDPAEFTEDLLPDGAWPTVPDIANQNAANLTYPSRDAVARAIHTEMVRNDFRPYHRARRCRAARRGLPRAQPRHHPAADPQASTPPITERDVPERDASGLDHEADPARIGGEMQAVRGLMWHYAGLVRNESRLLRAMVLRASIVARSALENRTSRGCHYREDGTPAPPARS